MKDRFEPVLGRVVDCGHVERVGLVDVAPLLQQLPHLLFVVGLDSEAKDRRRGDDGVGAGDAEWRALGDLNRSVWRMAGVNEDLRYIRVVPTQVPLVVVGGDGGKVYVGSVLAVVFNGKHGQRAYLLALPGPALAEEAGGQASQGKKCRSLCRPCPCLLAIPAHLNARASPRVVVLQSEVTVKDQQLFRGAVATDNESGRCCTALAW